MPVVEIIARLELDQAVEDPAVVWRGNVLQLAPMSNLTLFGNANIPHTHPCSKAYEF